MTRTMKLTSAQADLAREQLDAADAVLNEFSLGGKPFTFLLWYDDYEADPELLHSWGADVDWCESVAFTHGYLRAIADVHSTTVVELLRQLGYEPLIERDADIAAMEGRS